jgi:hypothetical protein
LADEIKRLDSDNKYIKKKMDYECANGNDFYKRRNFYQQYSNNTFNAIANNGNAG